jgi:sugar lactone lactonase YvrE
VTLASGQSNAAAITVDESNVCWTDWTSGTGMVMKVPLNGGETTTIAACQDKPDVIAVDATSVYWANAGNGSVMKRTPK